MIEILTGYSVISYSVMGYTISMVPLFSRHGDSELALILDIGSGSVGAAFTQSAGARAPEVLFATRADIPFQTTAEPSRLPPLLLRTLAQVMLSVQAEGLPHIRGPRGRRGISRAVVTLSAPWMDSKTTLFRLEQKKEISLTHRVIAELLQEDRNASTPLRRDETLVEEEIIKAAVNGYETAKPFGKSATEFAFTVFSSFSAATLIDGIEDTIAHSLHVRRTSFHSFSLAAFAVIRELFPERESFLFLDVSGEMSELSLVKKRALVGSATFPFGKNELVRSIASRTGLPRSGAETALRLHGEGRKEKAGSSGQEEPVLTGARLWSARFGEALGTLAEHSLLPNEVLLACDDDAASLLVRAIEQSTAEPDTLVALPLAVETVNAHFLASSVRWNAENAFDPFLAIGAAFGHLTGEK